jgi:hypothetical protein
VQRNSLFDTLVVGPLLSLRPESERFYGAGPRRLQMQMRRKVWFRTAQRVGTASTTAEALRNGSRRNSSQSSREVTTKMRSPEVCKTACGCGLRRAARFP